MVAKMWGVGGQMVAKMWEVEEMVTKIWDVVENGVQNVGVGQMVAKM